MFDCRLEEQDQSRILRIEGEILGGDVSEFRNRITRLSSSLSGQTLTVDLLRTTRICGAGISVLYEIQREVRGRGNTFILRGSDGMGPW